MKARGKHIEVGCFHHDYLEDRLRLSGFDSVNSLTGPSCICLEILEVMDDKPIFGGSLAKV